MSRTTMNALHDVMSKTKHLTEFSVERLRKFLASFDIVMSDIDGVLWNIDKPIEGSIEALAALKKFGKQVYLVTNNTLWEKKHYCGLAKRSGLDISADHIINSISVMIWYMKKINFHGELFAIVSNASWKALKEAGIQLTEEPRTYHSDPRLTMNQILLRPSVKGVITDFDVNCNWAKMALAISCLKENDILYLAGPRDVWIGDDHDKVLGPGPMVDIISELSGKKPILCAKPSKLLCEHISDVCNIIDPQRCLFIGDTIDQDMKFASKCGFTKLFVGTGLNKLEDAEKNEDSRPDYYLPALGQLLDISKSILPQNDDDHDETKLLDHLQRNN